VREDVIDSCGNSKEPAGFVKGEIFLGWFSDRSLLKDTTPWSSCELLNGMHAKPDEYAARGSPRAVSTADRIVPPTAVL
jgi:hypothetical protein